MSQSARPLPPESSAPEAERAFPQPVETHRDHRHVQTPHDGFQPALKRKQISRPADRTLRENADHMTAGQFGASTRDGLCGAVRLGPDGDGLRQPETPLQELMVVIWLPHQESDQRAQARTDQESVQISQVIGNQQSRPTRWNMLFAEDADPEQWPDDQLYRQSDQKL